MRLIWEGSRGRAARVFLNLLDSCDFEFLILCLLVGQNVRARKKRPIYRFNECWIAPNIHTLSTEKAIVHLDCLHHALRLFRCMQCHIAQPST